MTCKKFYLCIDLSLLMYCMYMDCGDRATNAKRQLSVAVPDVNTTWQLRHWATLVFPLSRHGGSQQLDWSDLNEESVKACNIVSCCWNAQALTRIKPDSEPWVYMTGQSDTTCRSGWSWMPVDWWENIRATGKQETFEAWLCSFNSIHVGCDERRGESQQNTQDLRRIITGWNISGCKTDYILSVNRNLGHLFMKTRVWFIPIKQEMTKTHSIFMCHLC